MRRLLPGLVALGLLLGVPVHARTQPSYTYTTIDVPGSSYTEASGINDFGQVVGYFPPTGAAFPYHGFLLSGSQYTILDVPGSSQTQAFGINASGQIVGNYY